MNTQSNQSTEKFFDLHTTGIGYLNRAREVPVKRGEPFLAVDINAMHGSEKDVQQVRFDCRVSGTEAKAVMRNILMSAVEAKKKVLVGFKLGDLYVDTFVYEKGDKAGQTGVSLKARLLRILWAKVDGEIVYRAPHESQEAHGGNDEEHSESAPMDPAEATPSSADETPSGHTLDGECVTDQPSASPAQSDSLPTEVKLSKDDPEFEQKKQELKDKGYRWNKESQSWCLPEQRAA